MTKTQRKNGQRVFDAAQQCAAAGQGVWKGYFFVADVAKRSGMSKPTCQKYLDIMVETGTLSSHKKIERMPTMYKWEVWA